MTSIKERVLYISDYKKINKKDFFKNLGLSYANFKGIQKKSALSSDAIVKILSQFPEISIEWLILGEGEVLKKVTGTIHEPRETYGENLYKKLAKTQEELIQVMKERDHLRERLKKYEDVKTKTRTA